jgi:hypothetical protein
MLNREQVRLALFGYEAYGGRNSRFWLDPREPDAVQRSEAFAKWLGTKRPFSREEVTCGSFLKIRDDGALFVVKCYPDGKLTEGSVFDLSDNWDGSWRLEEGILVVSVGPYVLDIHASTAGFLHSGAEVKEGESSPHAYFRVFHIWEWDDPFQPAPRASVPVKEALERLQALKSIVDGCVRTLANDQEIDRVEALLCLAQLKQFLSPVVQLTEAVPGLVQRGVAGQMKVASELREQSEALQEGLRRIEEIKQHIQELQEQEKQLAEQERHVKALLAEEQELREKVERRRLELERLKGLANPEATEELRRQLDSLKLGIPQEVRNVEELERHLLERSQTLVTLHEEVLGGLEDRLRQELEQLREAEQKLKETDAALRDARARYDEVESQLRHRSEELKPYIEADRIIAQALPNARGVGEMLDQAERLIREGEEALRLAIQENEGRNRRQRLYMGS